VIKRTAYRDITAINADVETIKADIGEIKVSLFLQEGYGIYEGPRNNTSNPVPPVVQINLNRSIRYWSSSMTMQLIGRSLFKMRRGTNSGWPRAPSNLREAG